MLQIDHETCCCSCIYLRRGWLPDNAGGLCLIPAFTTQVKTGWPVTG